LFNARYAITGYAGSDLDERDPGGIGPAAVPAKCDIVAAMNRRALMDEVERVGQALARVDA
jgi:hypothetical protein